MNADVDMDMQRLLDMASWQRDDLAVKRLIHREKARRRALRARGRPVTEKHVTRETLKTITRDKIDALALAHAQYQQKYRRQNYVKRNVYHPQWNPTGTKSSREHKVPEPAEEKPQKKKKQVANGQPPQIFPPTVQITSATQAAEVAGGKVE